MSKRKGNRSIEPPGITLPPTAQFSHVSPQNRGMVLYPICQDPRCMRKIKGRAWHVGGYYFHPMCFLRGGLWRARREDRQRWSETPHEQQTP